jgi:hypothetical protein
MEGRNFLCNLYCTQSHSTKMVAHPNREHMLLHNLYTVFLKKSERILIINKVDNNKKRA